MIKKSVCASAFALALVMPLSVQAEPVDGATAARSWLSLLDQSTAGACWATPSATKEDGVSTDHLLAVVQAFRGRFGEPVERAIAAEENNNLCYNLNCERTKNYYTGSLFFKWKRILV